MPKKNWLTPKHRALVNTLEKVAPEKFSIREFVSVYVLRSQIVSLRTPTAFWLTRSVFLRLAKYPQILHAFPTMPFSPSGLGESLSRAPRLLCGTPLPEFSVSLETGSTRLTRFVSRFPLFELLAHVYSGGCFALSSSHSTAERPPSGLSLWC